MSDEPKKSSNVKGRFKKRSIALVILISAVLLMSPVVYFWSLSESGTAQTFGIHFTGPNQTWFDGQIRIGFEDGQHEDLTPWPVFPLTEEGSQVGWESWVIVNRTFDSPETCSFEYDCSELDLTVGPLTFRSNQPQILYQDESSRVIETWIVILQT